jgi:hypothetical protein
MSWEVWGTPPDPEPSYCPQCGEQHHVEGCELGAMQARAVKAELQRDQLLEALRAAHDHLDMWSLEVSHCKHAALIRAALKANT